MTYPNWRPFVVGLTGVPCVLFLTVVLIYGRETTSVVAVLWQRTPFLLGGSASHFGFSGGFSANIVISLASMAIAIVAGASLGLGMISPFRITAVICRLVMNILRNSPWLVILYAMLYLIPFEFSVLGIDVQVPPMFKAIIGLSLPVTANMAEIFRGGVESVPEAQWESARSLGYTPMQVMSHVVVPQAVPRMIPNVMTLYAWLVIGTSLAVVTGTADVLTIARTAIEIDGEEIATAMYLYVLLFFFLYCFPIATISRALERKWRTVAS